MPSGDGLRRSWQSFKGRSQQDDTGSGHDPRLLCEEKRRGPCTFAYLREQARYRTCPDADVPLAVPGGHAQARVSADKFRPSRRGRGPSGCGPCLAHGGRQARDGRAPDSSPYTRREDLVRRVDAVDRLKRSLLVVASGLVLLALAVLIVLTNAVALVVTLAIVATIILLLFRWGLAEERRTKVGG